MWQKPMLKNYLDALLKPITGINHGRNTPLIKSNDSTVAHKLMNFFFCAGDELQYGIPHIVNCD